ncbi:hypothetical protein E2562_019287 [Oryza meyeriana var. granulata]|uniref:Uncharacterized protein n=1 Tax=Oryza meyeriana var. granulata TaxID=110450 RepID=A0A6G1FAL0_9ORYZ|nr:hypothetical protein E2562_019287 [Oryza meyeriana var. granulata]
MPAQWPGRATTMVTIDGATAAMTVAFDNQKTTDDEGYDRRRSNEDDGDSAARTEGGIRQVGRLSAQPTWLGDVNSTPWCGGIDGRPGHRLRGWGRNGAPKEEERERGGSFGARRDSARRRRDGGGATGAAEEIEVPTMRGTERSKRLTHAGGVHGAEAQRRRNRWGGGTQEKTGTRRGGAGEEQKRRQLRGSPMAAAGAPEQRRRRQPPTAQRRRPAVGHSRSTATTVARQRWGRGAGHRDIRQRRQPTQGRTGRAVWCSPVAGDDLGRHIGVGLQSQGDDGSDCPVAATWKQSKAAA